MGLPAWVEEARRLPLAFAQVREDALVDVALVSEQAAQAKRPVRVLMVASGGCTAAALARRPCVDALRLADPNPAQLALARLKLRLLGAQPPRERLALLGHAPLEASERAARLDAELAPLELTRADLGPPDLLAELGPDHAGRYEHTFAALRRALAPREGEWQALLALDELGAQARALEPLRADLQAAFERVFALGNLVALFGEGATSNPARSFAEHFTRQTCQVITSLPAASNPYLWQVLAGRFPPARRSPWLELPRTPERARVSTSQRTMNEELARSGGWDLIHLSNVLDWLRPEEASETLALSARALVPGGRVVIRQLNSTLDVRAAGAGLAWENRAALHAADRSYFYSLLHVGRRPHEARP